MTIEELFEILLSSNPSKLIRDNEDIIFELIPELETCKGFEQHSSWHTYDVYEHTLHVVDGVEPDLVLRLTALFHDLGKPLTFTLDEKGEGHFYGHYAKSTEIFKRFAAKYHLDEELAKEVSKYIYYHDLNLTKLDEEQFNKIKMIFSDEEIKKLYQVKLSDLLAHSEAKHHLYPVIEDELVRVLKKYE